MGSRSTKGTIWDEVGFFGHTVGMVLKRSTGAAIRWFDETFSVDTDYRSAYFRDKGIKYAKQGRYTHAAEVLEEVVQTNYEDFEAGFHLAFCYLKLDKLQSGINLLSHYYKAGHKDAKVISILGMALIQSEMYEDAVEVLKQGAAENLDNFNIHYRLGMALDHLERYDEALLAFQNAMKLRPEEPRVYRSIGFAMEQLGMRDQAVQLFKRAAQLEEGRRG
ncbi:Tetratricopeptide TPR_2 repeat protein [Magnetococcus marinus MC-1]|uniref:Tetratricopeptide TPR_2 repeat protein n=1 Tax=Magnetococcus marinus (strain ATCC BAA-1437 / JCM 17883 / MC-1) TaxID=156889 RepID=A0L9W1_MAGMM|nr:tetratricopeptide repeat protein [Magnetococcus marinus]ABK44754.1 Tetratricopeptide TPR_2 repeat protein [Magnetococcus marinus MC-1]